MTRTHLSIALFTVALAWGAGCAGNPPPASTPAKPSTGAGSGQGSAAGSGTTSTPGSASTVPPPPALEPPIAAVPNEPPIAADPYTGQPPDVINKLSPLKPVFFAYDSDQLDDAARQALTDDAQVLKKYPSWVVTIEGHSDERGTAEYNLALGERRALSARSFLLSLGLPAAQLRTVSYGKEFPFDPGHNEDAWTKNRRAHLVVTANK